MHGPVLCRKSRSWTSMIFVGPFQLEIFYDKKVFHENLETEFLYLIVTFYFWCRTPVVLTEPGNTQKTHRGGHSSLVWQLVLNVKLPAEQFPLFADSVAAFPSQHWQQLLGISVKWPRAVGQTGIPQEYGKRRPPGERSFRFGANKCWPIEGRRIDDQVHIPVVLSPLEYTIIQY